MSSSRCQRDGTEQWGAETCRFSTITSQESRPPIIWTPRVYLSNFKGTVVAITNDHYFLENSCDWILELDRREGIPCEGNYSSSLENDERFKRRLSSTVELEWMRFNPKSSQTKSKARNGSIRRNAVHPCQRIDCTADSPQVLVWEMLLSRRKALGKLSATRSSP